MARSKNFKIDDMINYLQGSCKSLAEYFVANEDEYGDMEEDDLTDKDYSDLEDHIFLCTACNWWCEEGTNHGENGDNECDDCFEDEDNEDKDDEEE